MAKKDMYKVEDGKLSKLRRECPKCGAGVFMAVHKDRVSCGKCGYTEFKKAEEKKPKKSKKAAEPRPEADEAAPSIMD